MDENNLQKQIDHLNQKIDLILEYVNDQRLKGDTVQDLVQDLSIIGKDLYDTTVDELDRQQIEIDPEAVKVFLMKLLRNLNNFSVVLNLFESMMDLSKDLAPITREAVIDLTYKLNELDRKGYFEFFSLIARVIDNLVTSLQQEELEKITATVPTLISLLKSLIHSSLLKDLDHALKVYRQLETEKIPEYSVWKTLRAMNNPEMKQAMGFMVTFLKALSSTSNKNT